MILTSYVDWARTGSGSVIGGADVEVRYIKPDGDPGLLAPIYSDADGTTPIAQTFNATSAGLIQFYAAPGRYYMLVGSGASQITVPIELARGESDTFSPLNFGAAGDGSTDDRDALQSMIQYLADNPGASRIVDLGGRTYLLGGYLYLGRFDWNQDGTYDEDTGPIANVRFTNGALKADPTADWTSPWPETNGVWDSGVPSAMVYVGDVVNQNYAAVKGENEFDVAHIEFDPTVTFECSFKTGGVWIENTHRVTTDNCKFYDLGIDCWCVAAPQTVGSARGYTPINQQTRVLGCRMEGNRRSDGIENWPGKVSFNGGSEIAFAQDVPLGALTINGAYTSGGEFTSDIDEPMFVAIQNVFDDTLSTDYYDFRDVTFTITGFADFAKTIPLTEDMVGPRGGKKIHWSYSMLRYAVITSITSDTAVASGARNQILVSTDYRNGGVRMGTHDAEVRGNNMTALSYAAVMNGRAGSFLDNHPWSRYVLFTDNSRKMRITSNYFDFTTVDLRGQGHIFTSNANNVGSPAIHLYPNKADDTGKGTIIASNSFTDDAFLYIEDGDGGNSWASDPNDLEYTIRDIPSASGTGYSFVPGFTEFGRGFTVNGYTTCLAGGEYNGTLIMRGNRIFSVGDPTDLTDAANKGYVDAVAAGGGSSDPTFNTVTVATTVIDASGNITGSPDATLGATTAETFNVAASTFISGTGYLTVGAGAEFAGFVEFNASVDMTGNRILNAKQVNFDYNSTEPTPNSDGDVALSDGTASTNSFGVAGAGLYRKQGSVWVRIG